MATSSREVATRGGSTPSRVDPAEEPSVGWGWHQHFPRATVVSGIVVGLILIALLIGHPPNGTELAYDVGIAIILIVVAVVSAVRRRRRWRP